ncbi:MAG: hypothetical protein Q9183_006207, partial [Haloplaca sp. 2 TL-2023]
MSPANPQINSQLKQIIYYHLDNHLVKNALFFAGRLQGYDQKSSDAAYLLAQCYFRLGKLKSAYDTSRKAGQAGTHLGCSYIFAQACLGLGKNLSLEGANALDKSKGLWMHRSGWRKLWHAHRDFTKAIESYAEALRLNPFMWDAFIGLSDLGANVKITNIFQMTPEMKKALQPSDKEESSLEAVDEVPAPNALAQFYSANTLNVNQLPGNNDPFSISKNRVNGEVRPSIFDKFNSGKGSETPIGGIEHESSSFDTPTGAEPSFQSESLLEKGDGSQQLATRNPIEPPAAPSRKARPGQGLGTELAGDAPPRMRSNTVRPQSRNKAESDETSNGRPPSVVNGVGERKRTISGQAASTASTAARSHEASNISDPSAPQRRS